MFPSDLDLSDLLEGDLVALHDDDLTETLLGLEALATRLEAARLRVQGEWDHRQAWAADGAVTGGQWLASRCQLASSTARERLRTAKRLRSMPLAFAALADGEITYAKARALAGIYGPSTAEAYARDEEMLVDHARTLTVEHLLIALRAWVALNDPDRADADHERRHRDRRCHLSPTLDGTSRLDANLTAEGSAVVGAALEHLTDELWRANPDAGASPVTLPQRRHDALVEMARRAMANGPDATRPVPLFVIHLSTTDLTAGGPAVDPLTGIPWNDQQLRRLACDAGVARVITDGAGQPLDLGRTSRNPSPAQRRAVRLRDKGCAFPGCDRPPSRCQPHHIRHWADGGPTDLTNLVLVCTFHHHAIHDHGYRCSGIAPDQLTWTRPDGTPITLPHDTRQPVLVA